MFQRNKFMEEDFFYSISLPFVVLPQGIYEALFLPHRGHS